MDFKGKVALITGGTSGIGRATAQLFAKHGARVVVTGRRESEGTQTVNLIRDSGGEALFIKADVSQESEVQRMVAETVKTFGRLDIAFNNAGVEGEFMPVTEQTVENFHHVMNINVLGVLLSIKHEVQAMRKVGGGVIVNNSSIAGLIGMPTGSVYIGSKHAVHGITKSVALELATENIRVNAVSPGGVETDMYDRFTNHDASRREAMSRLHPIGRVGTPEEIAAAVLFLAAPGASFMTGANIVLDGGFTAQ